MAKGGLKDGERLKNYVGIEQKRTSRDGCNEESRSEDVRMMSRYPFRRCLIVALYATSTFSQSLPRQIPPLFQHPSLLLSTTRLTLRHWHTNLNISITRGFNKTQAKPIPSHRHAKRFQRAPQALNGPTESRVLRRRQHCAGTLCVSARPLRPSSQLLSQQHPAPAPDQQFR